jgi:hypothetical protein
MSMISLLLLTWLGILAVPVGVFLPEMMAGERVASARFSTCQIEATDSKAR